MVLAIDLEEEGGRYAFTQEYIILFTIVCPTRFFSYAATSCRFNLNQYANRYAKCSANVTV